MPPRRDGRRLALRRDWAACRARCQAPYQQQQPCTSLGTASCSRPALPGRRTAAGGAALWPHLGANRALSRGAPSRRRALQPTLRHITLRTSRRCSPRWAIPPVLPTSEVTQASPATLLKAASLGDAPSSLEDDARLQRAAPEGAAYEPPLALGTSESTTAAAMDDAQNNDHAMVLLSSCTGSDQSA